MAHRPQRSVRVVDIIVVIALAAAATVTMRLASAMPTYTDEVSARLTGSRYLLDHGVTTGLSPQCTAGYAAQQPWFMTPVRVVEALIYGNYWATTHSRLLGILGLALMVGALGGSLSKALADRLTRAQTFSLLLSLFFVGVAPFCLTLTRHEQSIFLAAACLLVLPVIVNRGWLEKTWAALAMALVVLGCTLVLYTHHPKSLLLIFLIGGSTYMLVRRPIVRVATLLLIAALSARALSFWAQQLSCSEDPFMRAGLAKQTLSFALLRTDPGVFVTQLFNNLFRVSAYWENVEFLRGYTSHWMPALPVQFLPMNAVNVGIDAVFSLITLGIVVVTGMTARRIGLDRKAQPPQICFLLGVLTLATLASIQQSKYFYESTFVIPFAVTVFLIGVVQLPGERVQKVARFAVPALAGLALISQVLAWSAFAPAAQDAWATPGYVREQKLSVSYVDFAQARREILATASLCGIAPDGSSSHVVVDDVTYAALLETFQPFHALYVGAYWGQGIKDPRAFFTRWKSSGVVTECVRFPDALRETGRQNGRFCCHAAFGQ